MEQYIQSGIVFVSPAEQLHKNVSPFECLIKMKFICNTCNFIIRRRDKGAEHLTWGEENMSQL